jgi:hypothetical protein
MARNLRPSCSSRSTSWPDRVLHGRSRPRGHRRQRPCQRHGATPSPPGSTRRTRSRWRPSSRAMARARAARAVRPATWETSCSSPTRAVRPRPRPQARPSHRRRATRRGVRGVTPSASSRWPRRTSRSRGRRHRPRDRPRHRPGRHRVAEREPTVVHGHVVSDPDRDLVARGGRAHLGTWRIGLGRRAPGFGGRLADGRTRRSRTWWPSGQPTTHGRRRSASPRSGGIVVVDGGRVVAECPCRSRAAFGSRRHRRGAEPRATTLRRSSAGSARPRSSRSRSWRCR